MMKKQIHTTIQINATPEKIWSVLTDFKNYPLWNPFIKTIEGDVKVGNTIHVQIQEMNFKPSVLVFKKHEEFKWLGSIGFKGLFDGEHRFLITNQGDGTSSFEQSEKFSGILVGLFSKKIENETKQGFIKMNEKLKELAEKF